jgi:hypothetical protein
MSSIYGCGQSCSILIYLQSFQEATVMSVTLAGQQDDGLLVADDMLFPHIC